MTQSAAADHAGDVLSALDRLWDLGGGVSSGATSAINQAAAFTTTAQTVVYTPPVYVAPDLEQAAASTAPTVSSTGASLPPVTFSPRTIDGTLASGSADAPLIGEVTIPAAPGAAPLPAAPATPEVLALTVDAMPAVNVSVADAPNLPTLPSLPDFTPGALAQQTLAALTLPVVDGADLDAALARLRNARTTVSIPRYTRLLPQVFDAAGALLSGDLVVDVEAAFRQVEARGLEAGRSHDALLLNLWSSRGLDAGERAVPQYNAVMAQRFAAQRLTHTGAARARWSHDLLRAAFDVGTAAHTMAMDIETGLYDVEWQALSTSAEAALEAAKALVMKHNADVLLVGAAAERYAGENEVIRAEAARYRATVEQVEATAQLNSSTADAFAAAEKAKGVEADAYRAKLAANEAKIKALRGKNTALAAQAEATAMELEAYKARVLSWSAEIERARTDYTVYSARARGVVAQNRAAATQAQLSNARNDVVAAQAQQAAAQAAASTARAIATAASEGASYTQVELHNAVEALKARLGAGSYQRAVMQWAAHADAQAGAIEGWASAGAAAVKFSTAAAEAAGRAAQLTQEVATKRANAHATALEAAGRAKAAIEAGRYAGFRASAVLSASGGFSESIGRSTTTSNETDTSTSYIDRYTY